MCEPKRLRPGKECLQPVLPDALTAPTSYLKSIVGRIEDKKTLSKVLRTVGSLFPLGDEHQFLKRVRIGKDKKTTEVLVKIVADEEDEDGGEFDLEAWTERNRETAEMFSGPLRLWKVPRSQARTRRQWEQAQEVWPGRFHEDKDLENLLANATEALWSDESFSRHLGYMELARESGAVLVDPAKDELLLKVEETDKNENVLSHVVMEAIEALARKSRESDDDDKNAGYLCTGYDLYLAREPCLMCSMALVHARIKRVFFARETASGGLKTLTKLHTIQSLNHLFEVYQVKV